MFVFDRRLDKLSRWKDEVESMLRVEGLAGMAALFGITFIVKYIRYDIPTITY